MSRQQRKLFPRMDINDADQDEPILASGRINYSRQNKIQEEYEAELITNGEIIEIDQEVEQTGIKKIEIINKTDSKLLNNLKSKQNRMSNDETYEQRVNKFDLIDHLDVQKPGEYFKIQ